MMSTKNEELAEQRDKESRMCNIIIHGKEENENQQDDDLFVKSFMQTVSESVTPKSFTRIGRQENCKRPIKVTLKNAKDKEEIMINLKNLKGKDSFKGISITDDYTVSEREMIRDFTRKAKERNLAESENSNFVWRVRGTPKNGLVLKRFMKVKQNAT